MTPPLDTLLALPGDARALLVLAHGAGAGMRHRGMEALAAALAQRKIATLRFEFPYMREGRRVPDRPPVLLAAYEQALAAGRGAAPGLPLFAGGRSMGGRMSTLLAARERPADLRGLVLFAFPLHAAKKPSTERARPLADVPCPMLFLNGDRDALAELDLLRAVVARLGDRAALAVVAGADHSFRVLRRSGRTDADVLRELAERTREFVDAVLG